ncbi:MAG: septum formation inhibitor Maf [Hahellaceae bacterium]|nr:septum formation inhibitor Maf [Hahellaceae bacterium]
MRLLLASTSPYRREMLQRLLSHFDCASPICDETPETNEPPKTLAARLSVQKAESLFEQHPNCWILGADQTASIDGLLLGKPGHREAAISQLMRASGQCATFYSGLALVNSNTRVGMHTVVETRVHFRRLDRPQIERYLDREAPFDCAGSFKIEGLGISLFTHIESEDPTALIGLPLIQLTDYLNMAGFQVP